MECPRCQVELTDERRWCPTCESDFDMWQRRHAGDMVWSALGGMAVMLCAGVLIPALGVSWLFALSGVFAGFGALIGIARYNKRRRRGQFLRGAAVPRAYLPER